mgnify:CR=1 FL=1
MKWIPVKDNKNPIEEFPLDDVFLCKCKDEVCFISFNNDDNHFYLSRDPAIYEGYFKLDELNISYITYWMPIPILPID